MSSFRFLADVTFEASSEEAALSAIAGRIAVVARHIGNGAKLEETGAFFVLTTGEGEPQDIFEDPIRQAQITAEDADAAAKASVEGVLADADPTALGA